MPNSGTPQVTWIDPARVVTSVDLAGVLRQLRRREARLRSGPELTYRELAARAGWSLGIVGQYLAGHILPPTDRFDTLIRLLGATPAEQGMLATARDQVEEQRRVGRVADVVVPRQLPARVSGFSGRISALGQLDALLEDALPTMEICVITGTAGVGKTALAVHWAHRAADQFPDGQLYVNLRGFDPAGSPTNPAEAIREFLDAFGVPSRRIPATLDAQAALYRSLLAGKRVLVVLDNARDAEQVRTLLPGAPGCFVVVTSRTQMAGLISANGAHPLPLDLLTVEEARQFLTQRLGSARMVAEPSAVRDIISRCAHLPLALAIAAARAASQPTFSLEGLAGELHTAEDRLAALSTGDRVSDVRTVFSWSYQALSAEAAHMFRLLGLHPGPDFSVPAAASLAGVALSSARALLTELTRAHLLAEHVPARYTCHDLLRLYARQRCEDNDADTVRQAALGRLYGWYLHSADSAARRLYPEKLRLPVPATPSEALVAEPGAAAQAMAWLDGERPCLVAAVEQAAEHGPRRMAWLLADTLRGYFYIRMHVADWLAVALAGLAAARADNEQLGQAAAHLSLADLDWRQGRQQQAIDHYSRAAALSGQAAWMECQATVLANLGTVYWQSGSIERAADHYRQALDLNQRIGHLAGEANCLGNLGTACCELGRLAEAADRHAEALALNRKIGSLSGEALALTNLGETYHLLGRFDDALDRLNQALVLHRKIDNRGSQAETLRCLAAVHRDAGRLDEALGYGDAALAASRETGNRRPEADTLNTLATVAHQRGEHPKAIECHQRALDLARRIESRRPQAEALLGLAASHRIINRHTQARADAQHALRLTHAGGYQVLEGQLLTVLARIHLDQGRTAEALDLARQALESHERTGYRLGVARTCLVLADAVQDTETAQNHRRRAVDIFTTLGALVDPA